MALCLGKNDKYLFDVCVLKDYQGNGCKLTIHRVMLNPSFEGEFVRSPKGMVNDEKLQENIIKARSRIFELALCNSWDYFTTFTIDKKKFNRYDLEAYHKSFSQWLRDYNKKFGLKIKYLTIPEQHKDGAWHEHGFIMGLPPDHLQLFDAQKKKLPKYIRDKLLSGQKVFDFPAYRDKFGWVDFEPIRSQEAVSKYVTKYISKDLASSVTAINAHLYYCSQGLNRATEIKRGTMLADMIPDYENDYVKVKWYKTSENLDSLAARILD